MRTSRSATRPRPAREHLAHGVQQRRKSNVLVRRRRRDRYDAPLADSLVEGIAELVVGELFSVEIAGEEVLVGLDDRLDELLPVATDAVGLLFGEIRDR